MKKNLYIIPPKWKREDYDKKEDCRILLMPDSAGEVLRYFDADCVVSYGMSEKCSVTFSSISDDNAVVSLQRELPTLEGELLERQEIPVSMEEPAEPEAILAAAGALLLLGANPESLKF
jgi:peroxiredoxin